MCAYNAAPYLDSSLASIAAQSRRPDEVVLVDDGSTDGTADIAEAWTGRLPIKVIRRTDNAGVGAARRMAIEASTGEWVTLLDADDYWFPDHLEVLCETYAQAGGVVTAAHYRWIAGKRVGARPSTELVPVPPRDQQPTAILLGNFLFSGSLFARELYDRVGGVRPEVNSEDWDLWIRMIRSGARVTAAPTVTLLYRQHPASVSSGESLVRGDVALLEQLESSTTGLERRQVRRALRRQRAMVMMLDGYELIRAGRIADGRRVMARAAVLDRSLRRGPSHWGGCITLRAAICVVAPRLALSVREARRFDPELRVGAGPDRPWLGSVPRSKNTT
jgi:glycosyltransferase involved in cell wall biosynthesis